MNLSDLYISQIFLRFSNQPPRLLTIFFVSFQTPLQWRPLIVISLLETLAFQKETPVGEFTFIMD